MRNLATYAFIFLFLSNCTNNTKKVSKTTEKKTYSDVIKIKIKFNTQKEQEVNLNYVDGFNDKQSFKISKNDTAMYNFEIKVKHPIFTMDWSINQTYYVFYPNEKITIEPSTEKKQSLTVNSSSIDQNRKNELLFFQALGLAEKTDVSEQVSKILEVHSKKTGSDLSALLAIIELAKYMKNKNTDKAYQFINRKYERRINFLKSYKTEHPISNQFDKIVSKFFQFEFESNAFEILKNAVINHNETSKELKEISAQAMSVDPTDWLFIPTYQNRLKNYLSYSFLKLKITGTKEKIDFISKGFGGAVRDFCLFLVFKNQKSLLNPSEMDLLRSVFTKNGKQYLDYIKKNQEFYLNAGKNLNSNHTQLQSFTGTKISFENLIKSYEGKVILLDFWASWCTPCKVEIPFSKRLHDELKGENVEFVYLSLDKNYNNWYRDAKLLGLEKNSFLINSDFNAKLAKNLKISSIPRYVLINKMGEMIDLDAPRPSDPKLKTLINAAL